MKMKIEAGCPFWPVCGAAPVRQYLALAMACNDEYLECEHYKIRTKPERQKKIKLSDVWGNFCLWLKHKKPGIVTFLV